MKKLTCLLIILALGWFASSCGKKSGEEAYPQLESSAVINPLMAKKPGDMIARVDGKNITRTDVEQETNSLMMQLGRRVSPDQANQMLPMLQRQALENLINRQLLQQAAKREKLEVAPEAVEERVTTISAQFPSPEMLKERLAAVGISEETFRQQITQTLEIEKLLDIHTPLEAEVTGEEVETFYTSNPNNFREPERVQTSHILISIGPEDTDEQKEQKRQRLAEIKTKIEEGADFAEMAREHSACPSGSKGGDLGLFGRGQMVKPFEEVAFTLPTGAVSDIVETQFGYHLIKVTDHQEARVIPVEEAREKIENFLKNQRREQLIIQYLGELRNKAEIKYAEGFQPLPPQSLPPAKP